MVKYTIYEGGHTEVNMDDPDYKKGQAIKDIRKVFHNLIAKSGLPFITESEYKEHQAEITILAGALRVLAPEVEIEFIKKKK